MTLNRNAASKVHHLPELRRHILRFLSPSQLLKILPVNRLIFQSAAELIYARTPYEIALTLRNNESDRATFYRSCISTIDASDPRSRPIGYYETLSLFSPSGIAHIQADFPNIQWIIRDVRPFFAGERWTVDVKRRKVRYGHTVFLTPENLEMGLPSLLSAEPTSSFSCVTHISTISSPTCTKFAPIQVNEQEGNWPGWEVNEEIRLAPSCYINSQHHRTLLDRLLNPAFFPCNITRISIGNVPVTLSALEDIYRARCPNAGLQELAASNLFPFSLDQFKTFLVSVKVENLSLGMHAKHEIEEVDGMLKLLMGDSGAGAEKERGDEVKARIGLKRFEFNARLDEHEESDRRLSVVLVAKEDGWEVKAHALEGREEGPRCLSMCRHLSTT
ncbi:hypothetical protein M231_07583 [Tremella mesenterica]|uniref:Uncharacterized protein n=1 Tax=Tremella mesenterica TaxID=5217 RepID=A0A4Q1BFJ5_TREME|nr:hypothetical protein M231_07583 [Tremella mesenterica]